MNPSKLTYRELSAVRKFGTRADGSPYSRRELHAMGASGYDTDAYTNAHRWDRQHPLLAALIFFGICCPLGFWVVGLGIAAIAS